MSPKHSGKLFNRFDRQIKRKKPRTAASCFNTGSTDQVRRWEKAHCFTLLKRITGLKCVNSEIKSNVESCCLARHSPKGSYHLVEPAGRTHLYRKAIRICDLECIEHVNQQRNWNPVKKLAQSAAWKSEMDRSSVLKWTEAQCWKKNHVRRAGSRLGRMPLTKIGKSAGTSRWSAWIS